MLKNSKNLLKKVIFIFLYHFFFIFLQRKSTLEGSVSSIMGGFLDIFK